MVLTIKGIPNVQQFNLVCFTCSLKTGTLIIGQLGLLLYLIHTVEAITSLCFYDEAEYFRRGRQGIVSRLTTGILEVLLHVLLIYGAWKDKPELMLPFVMINYIMLIILVIGVIIVIIVCLYENLIGWAILALLLGALIAVIFAYLWAGVYSYYRQLAETNVQLSDTYSQTQPRTEETSLYTGDPQRTYQDFHMAQPQPV